MQPEKGRKHACDASRQISQVVVGGVVDCHSMRVVGVARLTDQKKRLSWDQVPHVQLSLAECYPYSRLQKGHVAIRALHEEKNKAM
jgi:mRNA-degrading endonuclease toxin of MazEF toxin-antitoxin module